MTKIADLKVKLFADGADRAGMLEMYANPYIKGMTTNPTLMKKILCGWRAAGLGRLSFHTSMEATNEVCHVGDRCRDHRPRE